MMELYLLITDEYNFYVTKNNHRTEYNFKLSEIDKLICCLEKCKRKIISVRYYSIGLPIGPHSDKEMKGSELIKMLKEISNKVSKEI